MANTDPRIDAYIAKAPEFAQTILLHLRAQIHEHCPAALETIKWGMPHFTYRDSIFCSFAAFKQHCSFSFWLGELLAIQAKTEAAMGQFGRITSLADLPGDKDFAKLIRQAMQLHDAGVKAPSRSKPAAAEKKELEVPPAFLAAVKKNKLALATFEAFSPSKKKEYLEWYSEAKTDATREKRLAQAIEWMAEGKSRNWKYQNC